MFTGIVEEVGTVVSFEEHAQAWRLVLQVKQILDDVKMGDSVAVNGCCLTVVSIDGQHIAFDLLDESKRLTSIDSVQPQSLVNLERALLPTTRMGGHFVSGHVDCTAQIQCIEARGKDVYFRIEAPEAFHKYLVSKGCITIDGISLTVAEVESNYFAIWLIPHTMQVTNLHTKSTGDRVNLEFDLMAKYVERLSHFER